MRILFDILHPAHVHVFRNPMRELMERGHEVRVTLREKECARELLDRYGFSYEVLSRQQRGVGLAIEFVRRSVELWRKVAEFEPHFLAGIMGPNIAPVGRLRRMAGRGRPRVAVFYDTEIAKLTNAFAYPLADYVCTPDCYQGVVHGNHLRYPGYHELSYLHPRRFTPDAEVVRAAGIEPASRYFLVRFVSYQASHDWGTHGLDTERKATLVRALADEGRVVLSSEHPLPSALEPYRLRIPVHQLHHVLAFASFVVGESATMASEAAVLGVPAAYISPLGRGYTDEQERRYGLVHNFTGAKFQSDIVAAVLELARDRTLLAAARRSRERLLADKVDVASWITEFFEREYARHFASDGS